MARVATRRALLSRPAVSTGGPQIDPASVANLAAWFKADALVLNDGDAVDSWTDSSGNSRTVVQATAGNKPTYKTGILNGKPVVRFLTDDKLSKTSMTAINQPLTVIVTAQRTGSTAARGRLLDSTGRFLIDISATKELIVYAGTISSALATLSSVSIISVLFNGASSEVWVNGASVGTGNWGTGGSGTTLNLGTDGSTDYFDGDIAEVCIYGAAVSASDRQGVQNYMAAKYNIVVV